MFYCRVKRHFREKRGSVSKRLAHFERVLDGNRRILRKKMQSTLIETNSDKISKKPQKTRPKKKRGKNPYETQETSKREEAGKPNRKLHARTWCNACRCNQVHIWPYTKLSAPPNSMYHPALRMRDQFRCFTKFNAFYPFCACIGRKSPSFAQQRAISVSRTQLGQN